MSATATARIICTCTVCKGRSATVRANSNIVPLAAQDNSEGATIRHNVVANAYGPMGRILGYTPTTA